MIKILFFIFIIINTVFLEAHKALVFGGHKGWIGQKIVKILKKQNWDVYCANSRLENRESILREIEQVNPDFIINSAGIIGKPNVDWCEDNKEATIRTNILGIVNLVDIAYIKNIHITNISTGCIYSYNNQHPIYSGIGFSEKEEPNFTESFYSKSKVLMEKIILNYPNVLNLRVRMPISADLHPRSFIGKIVKYPKLLNCPNSMTVLEDLLPLIPDMLNKKRTGNYNFVNPGVITHKEIIKLYKEYINPEHEYDIIPLDKEKDLVKTPRSNCELSSKKLLELYPDIPNIKNSVNNIIRNYKSSISK